MASVIRIKRSSVSGNPTTLAAGELAYSNLTNNGSNGGQTLYIGMGTETAGNAANHIVIGGEYFTSQVSAATNLNTASTIVKRDASGNFSAGTISAALSGNASTATALATGRTISLTGDVSYTSGSFDGTGNVTGTATLANTTVTPGSYGSATAIPTFTVDSKGRLTAAGTASISTTLSIAGDTGTDSVSLGSDTLTISGGEGIDVAVTNNTITVSAEDATSSNKGVASFASADFSVSSGAVSISNVNLGTQTTGNYVATIAGTTNQVSVSGSGSETAAVTLSLPQNIHSGATPTFAGMSLTGNLAMGSNKITGLADPVDAQDAATKAYVDAARSGLDVKQSVRAATTANITLSGTQTIDGVALSVGNRVLVKDQTNAVQNGIYVVASGAWSRASDADEPNEVSPGLFLFVEEGSLNADNGYVITSDAPLTVGTDALVFTQFSGAGMIVAGAALTKTGNTLDVQVAASGGIEIVSDSLQLKSSLAGDGLTYSSGVLAVGGTADKITVSSDAITIASTYAGQTSITTLGTITTGTWNGTAIANAYLANSSVTVNGTSISLGSSGTITANTTNAITFNSTGGAAAGTTFNGSVARTVDYSTVGAAPAAGSSNITTVGTISSGTWNGTTIGTGYGGTGLTSYTTGDLIYASATNTLAKRAAGTDGQVLQMNSSGVPVWGDIDGGTY